MTHDNDCRCVNCVAKGKPIREVWLETVTVKELSEIEVFDWLQGYGFVGSLAQQQYIRKYGFLLIKLRGETDEKHGETTDHYNRIINGLNHDNRIQINRLKMNRKIIDKQQKKIEELQNKNNDGYKTTIQNLEETLNVALIENQRLADLQKELQQEKMCRKGAFYELDRITTELKLKIKQLEEQINIQSRIISQFVNRNYLLTKERDKLFKRCEVDGNDYLQKLNLHFERLQNVNGINSAARKQWGKLEADLAVALEQRTADWQRIKELEEKLQIEIQSHNECQRKLTKEIKEWKLINTDLLLGNFDKLKDRITITI